MAPRSHNKVAPKSPEEEGDEESRLPPMVTQKAPSSLFVLEPEIVYQFDLKSNCGKGNDRTREIRSMKKRVKTGSESKVIEKSLRPLLSGVPSDKRIKMSEKVSDEFGNADDLEIDRLGIKSGEDAVNYFTAATNESSVKFVHLLPAAGEKKSIEYCPYSLKVVSSSVATAAGDFYTMSRTGLVRCVLKRGANATEFIPMNEWVRHSTFFHLLRSISFFKFFVPQKMFRQWRSNVRQKLFLQQRERLKTKLFLARESFCLPLVELKKEISTLRQARLVITPKARLQSDPYESFLEAQAITRKEAANLLEAGMRQVVAVCTQACQAVQNLDKNRLVSAEDPRKRLDALVAAKLASKSAKTQSMNALIEQKKAQKKLALRAAEDRALLSDFVRLADAIMVQVLVDHVLESFSQQLLADFIDPSHKIGLFEVAVGFNDLGLVFTPSLDDFFLMANRIAEEVVALLGRVPRVLDARGCAEHCQSAAFASKFDELLSSLPRYKHFLARLRQKFIDDFEHSRSHNAANYEIVRPIYDAMIAFGASPQQGNTEHSSANTRTYAEVRAELEKLLAWQKDLEKLRTRDSVGTIEVTSRQLKQTLAIFIDTKLDLLKRILREKAQVECAAVLKTLQHRVSILEATPSTLDEYATYLQDTQDFDDREMRKIRAPVDQMYALLQANEVKIPPDELVTLDEMHTFASQYTEQLAKSKVLKDNTLQMHSEQLDKDIVNLNSMLTELTASLETGIFIDVQYFVPNPVTVQAVVTTANKGAASPGKSSSAGQSTGPPTVVDRNREAIRKELDAAAAKLQGAEQLANRYSGYKELFGYSADEFPALKRASDKLNLVDKLWTSIADWHQAKSDWIDGPLTKLNAEEVESKMQTFTTDAFSLNRKISSKVTEKFVATIDEFKPLMPLVMDLGNPALLPRHWTKLCDLLGKLYDPDKSFTLSKFLQWGISVHAETVNEISSTASGEASLEKTLDKMELNWQGLCFGTKPWRGGHYILVGIDEIQQELDDQITRTQAMRGSRFVQPFLQRATDWETMLTTLQDIVDNWLKVQGAWIYLESIFASDDIMRQIPSEGRMFKLVNQTWKESMAATVADPAILSVAQRKGLLESLVEANEKLERIQSGLNDYLETKRLSFPRFFFLSNDELLSILAETRDPLLVQPHLRKLFDGICNLEFSEHMDILAAYDGAIDKSERLEFAYEACKHEGINPRNFGGSVELWLGQVEAIMKKSLAYAIDEALVDFANSAMDRHNWLARWHGQTILTVNQITWVTAVETAITAKGNALSNLHKNRCSDLLEVVKTVRGDVPKALRKTLGSLIVMDVHNRDVTKELADTNLSSVNDFDWQAHLRYYWRDLKNGQQSKFTGEPGTLDCCMINASILYAYEYIGNCGRLVITPLTDRCYRTLMGAIHLNLGGAPEGPAGTGKTETTKDLAKAIAIQCIVTNCSDSLDYKAMGKFFRGLASSGAWACFDEFNRISLEVLSVIAQQVLTIQQAKARGAKNFIFEGIDLPLKPTCAPFITMNPGYAGRAELPDNLKVLFRTVAMMVPDYAMIGEILLYSMGYADAKALAVKIVTTYKLCSEQLSSQSHYDYGMRAVMAVLRAAGNLKRAEGHLPEDVLVLRSIIDVNLPKFLSPDVPLFEGITSDLFPGTNIDPPDRSAMYTAFKDSCAERLLQPTQYFWDKVVQIYDMMVVRHGFMIVGMPFSGKSSAWKVLADTLGLLHERFPEDTRWTKVWPLVQNPKSVNMGQLYGQFDPVSTEWTDGCLAINYRNAVQSKIPGAVESDRKWILLDGPVDAIWIENMNTVLDDNKKLCLMSGEIIAMSDTMSMIFEPMDLLVASPATVSRCGMIYMEPEKLGWQPILDSWLEKWKHSAPLSLENAIQDDVLEFSTSEEVLLRSLFDSFVEPCLAFVRREIKEMSPTVDSGMVVALLNLLREVLGVGIPGCPSNTQEDGSKDKAVDPERRKHLTSGFLFSLIWSIGVTSGAQGRQKFSAFLRDLLSGGVSVLDKAEYAGVLNTLMVRKWTRPQDTITFDLSLPNEGDAQDWCYDPKQAKWLSWLDTLPTFEISDDIDTAQILVPTACTAQISYILRTLVPRGVSPLIVGPTGTGKSVCVTKSITSELSQEKFKTITLGFSAKTSANMTQDIIDGSLSKRRKGVFGPPPGQQAIVFVDDVNLPEVETYGAQPPIELLRQIIDNGGCYDLKEMTFATIQDCVFVGAMGPAGGGRNPTTPRFLRHFSLVCVDEFNDATLQRIFTTIVKHSFGKLGFSDDVRSASICVVDATLYAYREVMKSLLPTPSKSHYVYNLRDFARAIQGVLMVQPSAAFENRNAVMRLWAHEALRVFSDRLVDDAERDWFIDKVVKTACKDIFNENFTTSFSHLSDTNDSTASISSAELRRLFFGDYMTTAEEESRPYAEVRDLSQLQQTMDQYLADYNAMSKKPMDLVLFAFAVEHVSRISRVLRMPGGNALLIGVGGSGRQSLTMLAASIAGHTLKRIELTGTYGSEDWREDMKKVLMSAGTGEKPVTFLLSDTQIAFESMVEDVNNILNSGMIPNLFPNDEKMGICEAVRKHAKEKYGRSAADMTVAQLFAFFVSRVRTQLHIVLAFSPIGDAFRERLRKFPSLVNCCALNWFMPWPSDALLQVAERFLADVELKDEVRPAIVATCQRFHEDVKRLSAVYKLKTGRITYVTPISYLELILAFKLSLDKQRKEVEGQKNRYENGLDQIASAERNVETMQQELTDLQPVLQQSQKDTDKLMAEIEAKLPGVRIQEEVVGKEAKIAQDEANKVKLQVDEVQADLDEAIPALNDALKALDTIKPTDIQEVKALQKPPATVKLVCEAVCVMLGEKPVRVNDPDDPSKKIMDYWPTAQKMLADKNFIARMKSYDKDNIPATTIKVLRSKYITQENFTPEAAAKASSAAAGLAKWCFAMNTYDRVAKVVAPKKEALAEAQSALAVTMGALETKKESLREVQDDLAGLQAKLEASKKKKEDLSCQVELCGAKLIRAKQLLSDLGGEKTRWEGLVAELSDALVVLTGDVLLAAGQMAYLGPYASEYRDEQRRHWHEHCKASGIPVANDMPSLARTLGDPTLIQRWHVDGLPTDAFSIDNAITVSNSRRWPLLIDPQGQAEKWIKTMEASRGLAVTKPNEDFLRVLENGIQFGRPVLLEGIGESLDSSLEPLLLKQLFVSAGQMSIDLGGNVIPYDENFRFYMCTKLPNPHYLPEVSVKVLLTNFSATPAGLTDQLLGVVVAEERADLQKKRHALIAEAAANAQELKDIEDSILKILSCSGSILDDESAITTLGQSKATSDDIKAKQKVADKTAVEIEAVRAEYRPTAFATQVLFFCIADLEAIEPTYSYSLAWFIALFVSSIKRSEPSDHVPTRLASLSAHFIYSLYTNVCRSLLEKDRLLFSFLLCVRRLAGQDNGFNPQEWLFLLTGGVALDNPHANPAPTWLPSKSWNEICLLSELSAFEGLRESFSTTISQWKTIFESATPHEMALPSAWDSKLLGLQRLCILRTLRPDKVVLGVQKFVIESMGESFVQPPPFDLEASFNDSSPATPLVFVLSPGSDPMGAIMQLAAAKKIQVSAISLGQGQGPVADKLIESSRKNGGSWCVLQNAHLAPSYMPHLEVLCASLSYPQNVDKDFRLWCTTYPSPVFPVSIIQNSVKMTVEPPKGLKANLTGSFSNAPLADSDYFESCSKKESFAKLTYSLCVFHAMLQERRLYGPLGWNIPYGFNESDLHISLQQLRLFLDENEQVPFKALKYCIGENNYGGRVTDGKDRRTLTCLLDRFFRPEVLRTGTALSASGIYSIPPAKNREEFLNVVEELPLVANPELFGLHENASITKSSKETSELFSAILLTEGGGSASSGANSADEVMKSTAEDILNKLPDEFDLEAARIRYPVRRDESMNTVLLQELSKFNALTTLIRKSLCDLVDAVEGRVVMSEPLEKLGQALVVGMIPAMWKTKSYPSFKPLSGYINDLLARLSFFRQWTKDERPCSFWVSAFFFQHAFFTASKQNYARANIIPIDNIGFQYSMLPQSDDRDSCAPKVGFYGYGLFFEGARWDSTLELLAESEPKVLFTRAPMMWFQPKTLDTIFHPPSYSCPVYKTPDRRGVLATTGHSTNFIMDIEVPSDLPESHWVQRGVALLSQLDD